MDDAIAWHETCYNVACNAVINGSKSLIVITRLSLLWCGTEMLIEWSG